jgi:peptide deformylase
MILPLAHYGSAILRKKTAPISDVTEEVINLIDDMKETLVAHNGLGLAAPQVNRALRLFVICIPLIDDNGDVIEEGTPEVFINPILSSPSTEESVFNEGCLSIPGIYEEVTRPAEITVEALNEKGETFSFRVSGLKAIAIMHENDHLNGMLFIDRIKGKTRKDINPMLRDVKRKYSL